MSLDHLKSHVAAKAAEATQPQPDHPSGSPGEHAQQVELQEKANDTGVVAIPDRAAQDSWYQWIQGYRNYWRRLLPEQYINPGAFELAALAAIQNSPRLISIARSNPRSIVYALTMCAHFGLMPDGVQAAIVPYGNTAGFVPMYRGYITLLLRHKVATSVRMKFVREGDTVELDNGKPAPDDFSHKINLLAEVPKGQTERTPLLAYAYAWLPGGERSEVVTISKERAKFIRDNHSKAWQNAENERTKKPKDFERDPKGKDFNSPWHAFPGDTSGEPAESMWLKTAMRELVKRFDITPPLISQLIAADSADSTTGQQPVIPAQVMRALASEPEGEVVVERVGTTRPSTGTHAYVYDKRTDPYCGTECGHDPDHPIHQV